MKLTVLSGLMGAGKSTRALKLSASSLAQIASRDDLRRFFPDADESELTLRLVQFARSILIAGNSVIVDACNLHPHDRVRWTELAEETGAELDWIHISRAADECVRRNAKRLNPVGAEAIYAMAVQYNVQLEALNGAAL